MKFQIAKQMLLLQWTEYSSRDMRQPGSKTNMTASAWTYQLRKRIYAFEMKETCSNDHNFYSVITNGHHLDTESSNMEILLTIVFGIMTNNTIILIHQNTSEKGQKERSVTITRKKHRLPVLLNREPN